MVPVWPTVLLAVAAAIGYAQYRGYQHYLREAKRTGFAYYKSPVFFQSIPWLLFQESMLPVLRRLPLKWTEDWLPTSLFYRIWHLAYLPFDRIGHDTFVITSPSGNTLWTCDATLVDQFMDERLGFTKPVDLLQILNVYGPTITASTGAEHARYRRIAGPSFSESTHQVVWDESIRQAGSMISQWTRSYDQITGLRADIGECSLHILSKAFFNKAISDADGEVPAGHSLTYSQAITRAFQYHDTIFLVPTPLLRLSPIKSHKLAYTSFVEFKKYMESMKTETERQLVEDDALSSRGGQSDRNGLSLRENFVRAGMPALSDKPGAVLPAAAVYGNFFIFILAAHETVTDTIANAIYLLACRPAFQKLIQAQVDSISTLPSVAVGSRDSDNGCETPFNTSPNYGLAYAKLWDGPVGALMQETLRLYAPLPFLPKWSQRETSVTSEDGQSHVIPAGTLIMLNTAALHRNPKYWPSAPDSTKDASDVKVESKSQSASPKSHLPVPVPSVSEFEPERWLDGTTLKLKDDPIKGSFIPFSGGARGCMGIRFGRIEFCAIIACIFAEWSIVLADTSDEGVNKAEKTMGVDVKFEMGVKAGGTVQLRLIKRQKDE